MSWLAVEIEIAPGEFKRHGDCTADDLEGAHSLGRQKLALYQEAARVVEDMAQRVERTEAAGHRLLVYAPAWERAKAFDERLRDEGDFLDFAAIPLADIDRHVEDAKEVRMHSRVVDR
jgi:hypothetical protein